MTSHGDQPPETAAQGFRLRGPENWRELLRTRCNVLIVGPDRGIEAFLRAAARDLLTPVSRLSAAGHLPPAGLGTVVLTDLTALNDNQQKELMTWLDQSRKAGTQVISIAPRPLFTTPPAVRLDLYYRLNTIYLELD